MSCERSGQADGTKDILRPRIENAEGAKFWLRVMNAVVDGLRAFRKRSTPFSRRRSCKLVSSISSAIQGILPLGKTAKSSLAR